MKELEVEGGIEKRAARYRENHRILVAGMRKMGFETLLPDEDQAPIITSFYSPKAEKYNFKEFYDKLKSKGFVIYPGKVTNVDSFRIGNIGHVFPEDMARLVKAVEDVIFW
jgi:2-aminoethylphosphonate-pyruvate transaminase